MLRLPLAALLALSLAACDPVAGADDPPPPPLGDVGPRLANQVREQFNADTGVWTATSTLEYAYDRQGLLVELRLLPLDPEDVSAFETYSYDALDRLAEVVTTFSYDTVPSLTLYRYEGESDRASEIRSGDAGTPFEDMTGRTVYTYDSQGRRALSAWEIRTEGEDWTRCSETDYTYRSGEDLDAVTRRGECFGTPQPPLTELISRTRYAYAGAQVGYTEYDRREDDAWAVSSRSSYTYNAAGDVSLSLFEVYEPDGSRRPSSRTQYIYEEGPVAARPQGGASVQAPSSPASAWATRPVLLGDR